MFYKTKFTTTMILSRKCFFAALRKNQQTSTLPCQPGSWRRQPASLEAGELNHSKQQKQTRGRGIIPPPSRGGHEGVTTSGGLGSCHDQGLPLSSQQTEAGGFLPSARGRPPLAQRRSPPLALAGALRTYPRPLWDRLEHGVAAREVPRTPTRTGRKKLLY